MIDDLAIAKSRIKALEKEVLKNRMIKESLEDKLQFETLLSEISSLFTDLPASQFDAHIKKGLRLIGDFMDVPLSSIGLFTEKKRDINIIISWASKSLEALDQVVNNPRTLFPWSKSKFLKGEGFQFKTLADLPPEASIDKRSLEKLNIKSVIAVPLSVGKSIVGCISISTQTSHRTWSEEQIQRLKILGEVIANAAVRKEKENKIQQAFKEIKKLKNQLKADYVYLREEIDLEYGCHQMIGKSDPIKRVFLKIGQIAPLNNTVIILGESGTGKELVARAIHGASPRKNRPMVKVNCASLPANLIENELFGHEKGAFTDANERLVGRFEQANGSTLFLDEIGELPLESQTKLLRVLQEGQFERLGGSKTIGVDVRIIAATNRDLEEEVKKGRFRQDLWYRLNVFPIRVPSLRERREDIPLLVNEFVNRSARKIGKTIERVPSKLMYKLQTYAWPGNIRELENVIERAVIITQGTSLRLYDKLADFKSPILSDTDLTLNAIERSHIITILEKTNWRVSGPGGAALILGLKPSTLSYRMEKLGIKRSSKAVE